MTRNLRRQLYRTISLIVHHELEQANKNRAQANALVAEPLAGTVNEPPLKPAAESAGSKRVEPTPMCVEPVGPVSATTAVKQSGTPAEPNRPFYAPLVKPVEVAAKRPFYKHPKRAKKPLLPTPL